MRTLVVAQDFPWPPVAGNLIRLSTAVTALSELGEVDLFALIRSSRQSAPAVPSGIDIARVETVRYPLPPSAWHWRPAWMARRGVPWEVVKGRQAVSGRPQLERFAEPPYDLVWFSTGGLFGWMGQPDFGPTVVDLDILESVIRRRKAELNWSDRPRGHLYREARLAASLSQERLNARDWDTFETKVAQRIARVVLCSDDEVAQSGFPNAVTIPNSYDRPATPLGRLEVSAPPVVLFQGTHTYMPNTDAALWFAKDVLPRLRVHVPDVRVRVVGTPSPAVKRLHDPPTVTVVGRVDSMDDELARADLSVVPLRYGGGTRLKILESFAHRIPVVSTAIGAEGLRVSAGEQLLLADDGEGFADACRRALTDPELRRALTDAAEQRYLEDYEGSRVRERVRRLALEVADPASSRR